MKIMRVKTHPGEAVATLSELESRAWCRSDDRDSFESLRDRMRAKAYAFMQKHNLTKTEIFAHARSGGHQVDLVEVENLPDVAIDSEEAES